VLYPKQVLEKVPRKVLHKHQVFPVDEFGDTIVLTLSQSLTSDGFREVQGSTTMEVMFYVSKISHVRKSLEEMLPYDAKLVEAERKQKAAAAQPSTWTDIFDTANKNIMKGLTRKQENPFRSG